MTRTEQFLARLVELARAVATQVQGLVLDSQERTWWVSLAGAGLIGLLIFALRPRSPGAWRTWLRRWTSTSARVDYLLVLVKPVVFAMVSLPFLVTAFGLALSVVRFLDSTFGVRDIQALPPLALSIVYTLALFLAWDASRFALHWAMHRFELLWHFHQVHHSAEVLTPFTLYRVHPVESALYRARGVVVTGVVTGVFFHLFRGRADELELFGINALGMLFGLAGSNLRHSHVWWSWGPLERWFISPAQHQMHHARDREGPRTNYGTWLSVWDRLLGTLRLASDQPPPRFGLPDEERNHRYDSVVSALFDPFWALGKRVLGKTAPPAAGALALLWGSLGFAAPPDEGEAPDPEPDQAEAGTDVEEDLSAGYERNVAVGSVFGEDGVPRLAGSAHQVTEAELEKHEHDDIHQVVATVPGVYVRGEDGYGLRPNIGLRGANSDRSAKITLMEDGVLLAPAPYAAPAAYYFPLTTRMVGVEVFKGPAAVRHGPNTIGGAINMRSRGIPEVPGGYVDLAAGRFGYVKGHTYWGTTYKGFGVLLEAARIQSSGFKELDDGGGTGFGKNEAMLKLGYSGNPTGHLHHALVLKGGFANELSNETYLGLSDDDFAATPFRRYAASQLGRMRWWRSQAEIAYVVGSGDVEVEARLYRHDMSRAWRKLNRFRNGPGLDAILANPQAGQAAVFAAILRGDEDTAAPEQALMVGTNDRTYVSQGVQALFRWSPEWKRAKQELEVGARLHNDFIVRDHTEDAYLMTSGVLVPEDTDTETTARNRGEALAAAFHVHEALTIVDRVTLAPGVRVELVNTNWDDRLVGEESHRFDPIVLPGLGLHVQTTKWLGAFAGAHRGFSPVAPGQPAEVRPEFSINYEAGLRALHRGLHAEAIGFLSDYSNLTGECTFSAGCDDSQINRQFNAGAVLVYGAESMVRYEHRFDAGVHMGVGALYTYTGSQFRDAFESAFPQFGEVEVGDSLAYVPAHVAGGSAGVGGRIWEVRAKMTYNSEMRDIAGQGPIPDAERIPGFVLLDLAGELEVLKMLRVYALVNNATNSTYVTSRRPFGSRPGAPLSFVFGVKAVITPPPKSRRSVP